MSNSLSQDPSQNLLPSTSFSALNWNPSQEPNPVVVLQSDLLIGHINQNPNIPAVTPNPSDSLLLAQIEGSIATIDPNITLPNDNSFDGLTGEAMDIVKEQLTQFAKVPNFVEKMNLAFGESWDTQAANVLTQDWLNGDFSLIPPVKFVSSAEIAGANGAFASATDTIYLSRELLAGNGANPATVADVLLEEIGHSVDTRLNVADSPGDEGAIFAAVVQEKTFKAEDLESLKAESDITILDLYGQKYPAEMNSFVIRGSIGSYYSGLGSAEKSRLGLPTSNEFQVLNGAGWQQNFQGGSIFHSGAGSYRLWGSLGSYYSGLGSAEKTRLGVPTGNEFQVLNGAGWQQNFQGGSIFYSGAGSYRLWGSLGSYYSGLGSAEKTRLGVPTGNEFQVPNGWRQNFQGGVIFHSGAGSYRVWGSLGNYYLNNLGGEKSQLGLPTSNEFGTANGWQQNFQKGTLEWLNNGTAQVKLNGGSASLVRFGNLSGNDRNLPGTVFPYSNPFATISNTTPERWLGDAGQRARYIQDPEMLVVANTQSRSADQIRQVINYFNVQDSGNLRYRPDGINTFCNIFARDVMRALRAPLPHWTNTGRELDANGMNDWLKNSANGWRKITPQDATRAASQGIPTVASWKNFGGIGHIAVVRPETGPTPDNPQIAQAGSINRTQTTVSVGFGRTSGIDYFAYYG